MNAPRTLAVLYGQVDSASTSYQTSALAQALQPWFVSRHLRIGGAGSYWRDAAARFLHNYVGARFIHPDVDDVMYGNDGMADLVRWRSRRLLYWYDAPADWSVEPPPRRDVVRRLRYRNVIAADHVFAVSRALVDVAKRLRPGREGAVTYLPVGVDCATFDPRKADPDAAIQHFSLPRKIIVGYLGHIGFWNARFAGEPLTEIARPLLDRHDVHFLVVGSGPGLETFQRRVDDLGVSGAFTFTGYVSAEILPSCIAAMDVAVDTLEPGFHSLARSETKLKQYMAMGRACLATAIGENIVDLEGGRCGVLVPPGADELLDGLTALVQDETLRLRLGKAARRRACEVYDWPCLAARMARALGL